MLMVSTKGSSIADHRTRTPITAQSSWSLHPVFHQRTSGQTWDDNWNPTGDTDRETLGRDWWEDTWSRGGGPWFDVKSSMTLWSTPLPLAVRGCRLVSGRNRSLVSALQVADTIL